MGLWGWSFVEGFAWNSSFQTFIWVNNFLFTLKTLDTKLSIKKVIRTESSLYAVGKLIEPKKKPQAGDPDQLSLYKLIIYETIKNQNKIEHQVVLTNLTLNEEKLAIAIDSQVNEIAKWNLDYKFVAEILQGHQKKLNFLLWLKSNQFDKKWANKSLN